LTRPYTHSTLPLHYALPILVSVGDDFFIIARVYGEEVSLFLSDVTASVDWQVARDVLDHLDIDLPDDDDLDQVLPAGDLSIVARSEEHTSELQSRFDLVCRL